MPVKHQETHPNLDVEGCFACKVSNLTFHVPNYMSAKTQPGGMSGIEANHALRKDMAEEMKNDKEGRFVKASRA